MGSSLIKNVNIDKDSYCQAGHCSAFQIFRGTRQDVNHTKVSIFQFEKKKLEKQFQKQELDDMSQFLKKEGLSLMKFRHPYMIQINESPLEDEKTIAFVTEPFKTNLQTLLNKNQFQEIYGTMLELKINVQELLNTLNYMHTELKMAHCALNPENIYISASGKWKLGGFIFSTQILDNYATTNNVSINDKTVPRSINKYPKLQYCAPEIIQNDSLSYFTSDVFSLGILILAIIKSYQTKSTRNGVIIGSNNIQAYRNELMTFHSTLQQYDNLGSSVLAITILILKRKDLISKQEYYSQIWPFLKQLAQGKEISAQSMWIIVDNIEMFFQITEINDFNNTFVPLVLKCYDCPVAKIQILALGKTEFFFSNFSYSTFLKQKIVPRLVQLIQHKAQDVREQGLSVMAKFYQKLDSITLSDQVLPALDKVRQLSNTPNTINDILNIQKNIAADMDADSLARKILPIFVTYLSDSQLDLNQYKEHMASVRQLLDRIDQEKLKVLKNSPVQDFNFESKNQEISTPVQGQQDATKQQEFDFTSMINSQQKLVDPQKVDKKPIFEAPQSQPEIIKSINPAQKFKQKPQNQQDTQQISQQIPQQLNQIQNIQFPPAKQANNITSDPILAQFQQQNNQKQQNFNKSNNKDKQPIDPFQNLFPSYQQSNNSKQNDIDPFKFNNETTIQVIQIFKKRQNQPQTYQKPNLFSIVPPKGNLSGLSNNPFDEIEQDWSNSNQNYQQNSQGQQLDIFGNLIQQSPQQYDMLGSQTNQQQNNLPTNFNQPLQNNNQQQYKKQDKYDEFDLL